MKRIEVYAVGILLALVPAVFGLWGNASFSKDVPVRVPDQARTAAAAAKQDTRAVVVAADRAGRTSVERRHARHGADDPATHDVNDDHGGDRSGASGGRGGADDPATHDVGDARGGGADDRATHDVNDDRGGATVGVHQGGGADDTTTGHHSGGDDGSGSGKSDGGSGSGKSDGGSGSGTSGGGSDDKGSGGHGSDD